MATVTLKNVPVALIRALKRHAKENRRSLNQEALARLEASTLASPRSGSQAVSALRRLHRRLGNQPPLTDSFLARAKGSGRK